MPPTLLVLRVFQQEAQARSLFDAIVERWRLSGNAVMIAGTDLADRTIDADDIFQFLDRRLSERFVAGPADVARRIGPDRIAEMARRFGLGEPTGVELIGEQGGLVPDRNWKLATTGVSWLQGETLNYGIGQGYLLTTPLQLAVMAARLASGLKVTPRLTRIMPGEKFAAPAPIGVSPANLKVVQEGMDMVVNGATGSSLTKLIATTPCCPSRRLTAARRLPTNPCTRRRPRRRPIMNVTAAATHEPSML